MHLTLKEKDFQFLLLKNKDKSGQSILLIKNFINLKIIKNINKNTT